MNGSWFGGPEPASQAPYASALVEPHPEQATGRGRRRRLHLCGHLHPVACGSATDRLRLPCFSFDRQRARLLLALLSAAVTGGHPCALACPAGGGDGSVVAWPGGGGFLKKSVAGHRTHPQPRVEHPGGAWPASSTKQALVLRRAAAGPPRRGRAWPRQLWGWPASVLHRGLPAPGAPACPSRGGCADRSPIERIT